MSLFTHVSFLGQGVMLAVHTFILLVTAKRPSSPWLLQLVRHRPRPTWVILRFFLTSCRVQIMQRTSVKIIYYTNVWTAYSWIDLMSASLPLPEYKQPKTFSWEKYLEETGTQAAPARAFKPVQIYNHSQIHKHVEEKSRYSCDSFAASCTVFAETPSRLPVWDESWSSW